MCTFTCVHSVDYVCIYIQYNTSYASHMCTFCTCTDTTVHVFPVSMVIREDDLAEIAAESCLSVDTGGGGGEDGIGHSGSSGKKKKMADV